jgi:NADH-quinone oxidoreductase subunit M
MDKVGTFGILRYCLPLFPERRSTSRRSRSRSRWSASSTRALLAVGQNDLKRLVRTPRSRTSASSASASSPSHCRRDRRGALHGQPRLATGLLFLVVGMWSCPARLDAGQRLRRRGQAVPVLAGVLFFAGLASLALPGLAPFVSEFLVLIGTFHGQQDRGRDRHRRHHPRRGYVLWMVPAHHQGTLNPALATVDGDEARHLPREMVVVAR